MRTKQILVVSIVATGVILLLLVGFFWLYSPPKPVSDGMKQAFNPSGDFTLTDDSGKTFHLKDYRGKVVLLYFGYTACPDICPATLAKLAKVRSLLGAAGKNVVTVFVTVDPKRDTPARLKEYVEYFDSSAIGLTGTKTEIDRVVNAYNASYQVKRSNSSLGYTISHTSIVYLIDKRGAVRNLFHQDDEPEKMASIVRESAGT